MSDEIEAVTETAKALQEVAKTTGKAVDLAQAGGSYLEPIQFTPVHILQRRNSFGIPWC